MFLSLVAGFQHPHARLRAPPAHCRSRCRPAVGDAQQLAALEARLAALEERLVVLERVAPPEFSVFHYNVLADQYASNLQPWFLYGTDVTEEERARLFDKFYQRNATGELANVGWPTWAQAVLSPERRAAAEAVDAQIFAWDVRRASLLLLSQSDGSTAVPTQYAGLDICEWQQQQLDPTLDSAFKQNDVAYLLFAVAKKYRFLDGVTFSVTHAGIVITHAMYCQNSIAAITSSWFPCFADERCS